ncbi:MAG TPA: hypothetical protein VFK04_03390 [Gemmatimonadaceae bacterium]|nr:hypothetical protein [Gemmatimonadaceae bacterium]
MAKQRNRHKETISSTPFEQARDELFQHIIRCGVLQAAPEHQLEWFDDTMGYIEDRYPELQDSQISELKTLGLRFCAPPKSSPEHETANAASAA